MEEFELVVAEEYKFENGEKKWHLREISDCQDTDARNTNQQFSHRKFIYN